MPNSESPYKSFHKTLTAELLAIKDRFRNLVRYTTQDTDDEGTRTEKSHWLTDGEWKESALRTVLRRHLAGPVGRGFVIDVKDSTTQIDILIPKPSHPFVFRDGDLFVLTADSAEAIIEVKTALTGKEIDEAVMKLARIGEFCRNSLEGDDQRKAQSPWLGLFVYEEGNSNTQENVMKALEVAYKETQVAVNCVSFGMHLLFRFWERGEWEKGDNHQEIQEALWKAYRLTDIAPSYFIGNVVDAACQVDNPRSDYAWFAYRDGKREGGELLDTLFVTEILETDEGRR